jgi:hypothetical protein
MIWKQFDDEGQGGLSGGAQVHGNFHHMEVYSTAMALISTLAMVPSTSSSRLSCHTARVAVAGS